MDKDLLDLVKLDNLKKETEFAKLAKDATTKVKVEAENT